MFYVIIVIDGKSSSEWKACLAFLRMTRKHQFSVLYLQGSRLLVILTFPLFSSLSLPLSLILSLIFRFHYSRVCSILAPNTHKDGDNNLVHYDSLILTSVFEILVLPLASLSHSLTLSHTISHSFSVLLSSSIGYFLSFHRFLVDYVVKFGRHLHLFVEATPTKKHNLFIIAGEKRYFRESFLVCFVFVYFALFDALSRTVYVYIYFFSTLHPQTTSSQSHSLSPSLSLYPSLTGRKSPLIHNLLDGFLKKSKHCYKCLKSASIIHV